MVRWTWRFECKRMEHKLNYWIHSSSTHAYLPHFIAFLSPFACTNGMKLMGDENQNILLGIRAHIGPVCFFFYLISSIFSHFLHIYLVGRIILSDSICKSVCLCGPFLYIDPHHHVFWLSLYAWLWILKWFHRIATFFLRTANESIDLLTRNIPSLNHYAYRALT